MATDPTPRTNAHNLPSEANALCATRCTTCFPPMLRVGDILAMTCSVHDFETFLMNQHSMWEQLSAHQTSVRQASMHDMPWTVNRNAPIDMNVRIRLITDRGGSSENANPIENVSTFPHTWISLKLEDINDHDS